MKIKIKEKLIYETIAIELNINNLISISLIKNRIKVNKLSKCIIVKFKFIHEFIKDDIMQLILSYE